MPDSIQHIVVLMMENRSFDQMLGCMHTVNPQIDGIDPNHPRQNNFQMSGTPPPQPIPFTQKPGSDDTKLGGDDPKHDYSDVLSQMDSSNSGFVNSFGHAYPHATADALQQIMNYFPLGSLNSLHTLAKNFLVCDRWFSSLPGPTWPNRLFAHSGTSKGHVDMSFLPALFHTYDQTTMYDLLSTANVSWRIYYGDIAQSLLLTRQLQHPGHYHRFDDDFLGDAAGPANKFPAYTFIEPHYFAPSESDQHPVHGVQNGEVLIAKVYNAIRSNADLWSSTLLIVVYDEHGGFYDHVWPNPNDPALGATVAPDGNTGKFAFNQLGIRVPAILVSPWVAAGVTHTKYDHTSVLHYAGAKFKLNLSALGKRVPQANSFDNEILAQPRDDTPAPFSQIAPLTVTPQTTPLTEHQQALLSLSQFLETQMAASQPAAAVKDRLLRAATQDPTDVASVVRERMEAFLTHQRAALGKALK